MPLLCFFSLQASSQTVIISEVADPSDEYQARYVELYNPTSSSVDISGWDLKRYANGNTTSCDATIPASTTIPSGGTYVIAYDASTFDTEFSCTADQEDGCITGNGNDVYELVDDAGDRMDIYGEVGVDGSGEPWEYEDAIAMRNSDVCDTNTTWTSSEWTITDPGGTSDATPCSHNANCGCSHSISSFSPTEGCPDTGTVTVTISGSGFTNGSGTSDVLFNGSSSPSYTVISDSEIEAEVPSGATDGPISVVTDGCTTKSSSSFDVTCTDCADLFVNEFSNGESGSREYVELIVGNNCGGCEADLRGWIIDDNNGDFSGGPSTGEGIAQGHVRFDPNGPWDSIPTGSIIVIYNDNDENLTIKNLPLDDDPHDSDGDSVYVIPVSDPDLQECSSIPSSSDASYSSCSYGSSTNWDPISMSNSQDAMQVRKPNGDYFHGGSYGSDASFDNGGPDSLHIHDSGGSGDCFYFGGSDARDVSNWSQGDATSSTSTTDETPGSANNSANSTYVDGLVCSTLPIELLEFGGKALRSGNQIRWSTGAEIDHDRFILQRSQNGKEYQKIAVLEGKGSQNGSISQYEFLDEEPWTLSYYRLKSVDRDGRSDLSRIIPIQRKPAETLKLQRHDDRYLLKLPAAATEAEVVIRDAYGRKLRSLDASATSQVRFGMTGVSQGVYVLRYRRPGYPSRSKKFVH